MKLIPVVNNLNHWQFGLTFLGVTCRKHQYKLEPTHPIHYQSQIRELIKSRLPSDEKVLEEVLKIVNSNIIINQFDYRKEGFNSMGEENNKYHFRIKYDDGRRIFYNTDIAGCYPF